MQEETASSDKRRRDQILAITGYLVRLKDRRIPENGNVARKEIHSKRNSEILHLPILITKEVSESDYENWNRARCSQRRFSASVSPSSLGTNDNPQ